MGRCPWPNFRPSRPLLTAIKLYFLSNHSPISRYSLTRPRSRESRVIIWPHSWQPLEVPSSYVTASGPPIGASKPFLTDRITHLHTSNWFPISILSWNPLLESPEGWHPPISKKRRNGKTSHSRPFQPFLTDRITHLHTYIRFPNSILTRVARLQSVDGIPAPIAEKKRNEQKTQSKSSGPI